MELSITNVCKNYGDLQALNNITLNISAGITGLLGPNGAGKSTLMKIISTIENPSKGKIIFNGIDIEKKPNSIRMNLGYLPQDFGVYPNLNPIEFLEYMAAMKSLSVKDARKRIDELLEILHLKQARKRLIGGFSGGMKQRVGIAQALLNDPDILIVDEPTVGLDPSERIQFRNLLSSLASNKIIILSTHIVSDIESIASSIAIMSKGKLQKHVRPEQLINEIEGKVWECVVSQKELEQLQNDFIVSSSIHKSDGIHAKIVSDFSPTNNSFKITPTLEDAYLYATSTGGTFL